jgi:hypothetical protein
VTFRRTSSFRFNNFTVARSPCYKDCVPGISTLLFIMLEKVAVFMCFLLLNVEATYFENGNVERGMPDFKIICVETHRMTASVV